MILAAIKDYENYQISNCGKVFKDGKEIKLSHCGVGYLKVGLWKNGKMKNCRIHRLVAQAFLPDFYEKCQINHIDSNKHNNHISNLEATTPKQNIEHAARHLRHNSRKKPLVSKAEYENILNMVKNGISTRKIAESVNRSIRCIQHIKSRPTRTNYAKNKGD